MNDNNIWTREMDKISLEKNGYTIPEITSILNELIGFIGEEWKFLSLSPGIYVNPEISVNKTRKEEIIGILKSNNLLFLHRGF